MELDKDGDRATQQVLPWGGSIGGPRWDVAELGEKGTSHRRGETKGGESQGKGREPALAAEPGGAGAGPGRRLRGGGQGTAPGQSVLGCPPQGREALACPEEKGRNTRAPSSARGWGTALEGE